jgi:molecular chaperone DnaJ
LDINVAQAALGDKIKVPSLDGDQDLPIPPGTQSGEMFRLRGKGVPYLQRNGRGDELVFIHVLIPTRLTAQQKKLLQELSETLGKEIVHNTEKGLFQKIKEALGA